MWVCKKCGSSERYGGRACAPCARALAAKRRALKPEETRAEVRKWSAANKERKAAADKAWRDNNRARYNAQKLVWKQANPSKITEARRKHYLKNKDKILAWRQEYYEKNPRIRYVATRKWKDENAELLRIQSHLRRVRKGAESGKIARDIISRLYAAQRGLCACCGEPLGEKYHVDHIMPLALGGAHKEGNLQLLRAKCNLRKAAKHPAVYAQECKNRIISALV